MTEKELGNKLNEMYSQGKRKKEMVCFIHLFGIKYGEIIKTNKYEIKQIINFSNIPKSYRTELSKGIKLSQYTKII